MIFSYENIPNIRMDDVITKIVFFLMNIKKNKAIKEKIVMKIMKIILFFFN